MVIPQIIGIADRRIYQTTGFLEQLAQLRFSEFIKLRRSRYVHWVRGRTVTHPFIHAGLVPVTSRYLNELLQLIPQAMKWQDITFFFSHHNFGLPLRAARQTPLLKLNKLFYVVVDESLKLYNATRLKPCLERDSARRAEVSEGAVAALVRVRLRVLS